MGCCFIGHPFSEAHCPTSGGTLKVDCLRSIEKPERWILHLEFLKCRAKNDISHLVCNPKRFHMAMNQSIKTASRYSSRCFCQTVANVSHRLLGTDQPQDGGIIGHAFDDMSVYGPHNTAASPQLSYSIINCKSNCQDRIPWTRGYVE